MNRILVIIILALVCQFNSFSQDRINDYKYIIIPIQFEFQKTEDQYQLNSLTKFLFNKYGYTAFLENEDLPNDFVKNRCLGLDAIVKKVKGGFLNTKVQIDLVDCQKQVIASSVIGKSKEKVYKTAYSIAIREAFKTYQFLDYNYIPNTSIGTVDTEESMSKEKEIERLKKEVEALKENSNASPEEPNTTMLNTVESPASIEVIDKQANDSNSMEKATDLLYAQPIEGGFQVVDTAPKKVMILLHSGAENYFIVQGKDAIVYKKGLVWIYAENDGALVSSKEIKLKF